MTKEETLGIPGGRQLRLSADGIAKTQSKAGFEGLMRGCLEALSQRAMLLHKSGPPLPNIGDLMKARRRLGQAARAAKPAKEPRKAAAGQKEMLMPALSRSRQRRPQRRSHRPGRSGSPLIQRHRSSAVTWSLSIPRTASSRRCCFSTASGPPKVRLPSPTAVSLRASSSSRREEPSHGIGWASRIFSRYHAARTIDGGQAIQLHGEVVRAALGLRFQEQQAAAPGGAGSGVGRQGGQRA